MTNSSYKFLRMLLGERGFLRFKYLYRTRKWLDLNSPVTFSEKLQWLKLHDRQPLMRTLADKIQCKEWVAEQIGQHYIIPVLKTFDSPAELTPENLPPPPFVLKSNHDSGGVKMVTSHSDLTPEAISAIRQYYTKRTHSFYDLNLEWEYKGITPRLFAEPHIGDTTGGNYLRDYKIHCFNGEPHFIQTISNRGELVRENWYDVEWEPQDIWYFSKSRSSIERPPCLEEMLLIARKLSTSFPYVRVDTYWTGERVLFGELTFRPYGGFMVWNDEKVDRYLGQLLRLPIT